MLRADKSSSDKMKSYPFPTLSIFSFEGTQLELSSPSFSTFLECLGLFAFVPVFQAKGPKHSKEITLEPVFRILLDIPRGERAHNKGTVYPKTSCLFLPT